MKVMKIPSIKTQIPNKSQYCLEFEDCDLGFSSLIPQNKWPPGERVKASFEAAQTLIRSRLTTLIPITIIRPSRTLGLGPIGR